MRKTTRSKYFGRTEIAQSLNSMLLEADRLEKSAGHHKLGGKRLLYKFQYIKRLVGNLHAEVAALPVTPDEKLLAKVKRKKGEA